MNATTTKQESAIARAEATWRPHEGEDGPFVFHLALYLRHGFVVNYPDLFAMARPVQVPADRMPRADDVVAVCNPEHEFHKPNAWFVWIAAAREGRPNGLKALLSLLPCELQFICFYRRNRGGLRIYPAERFAERAEGFAS